MRVRHGNCRNPLFLAERGCLLVATATEDPRVVALDPVDEPDDRGQLLGPGDRVPEPIERMRNADEPALLANRGDGFRHGPPGFDRPLEEHRDQVAGGGLDLLSDDHRQTGRGRVTGAQRTVDSIVIGDREMGQSPLGGGAKDVLRSREAVEAVPRVAVEVDEGLRHDRNTARGCGRDGVGAHDPGSAATCAMAVPRPLGPGSS